MAALNFPDSPSVNDQYTANGSTWEWDGVSWNIVPASSSNVLFFPFFNSSVVSSPIRLISNQSLPFFKADGTGSNISVIS